MAEETAVMEEEQMVQGEGGTEDPAAGTEAAQPQEDLQARVAELEGRLHQADGSERELRASLGELRERLSAAVASYRAAVLVSAPDVPQELVSGESVEEVDASLARARQMVERIRARMETQAASQRVPAGAPARSGPDLSALSPHEKILYALRQAG
ncbi:MAG: hypothetical protein HYY00_07195 [Chloroflexi bacterium]|nr:hypothetical protein [Chloroflexota bacterium]